MRSIIDLLSTGCTELNVTGLDAPEANGIYTTEFDLAVSDDENCGLNPFYIRDIPNSTDVYAILSYRTTPLNPQQVFWLIVRLPEGLCI